MSDDPWSLLGRSLYYDLYGNPITLEEYARLLESRHQADRERDPTRIGLGVVKGLEVSTVWLGIDHAVLGGPLLIFEAMVFDENGDTLWMERYATKEEAREGHNWIMGVLAASDDPRKLLRAD